MESDSHRFSLYWIIAVNMHINGNISQLGAGNNSDHFPWFPDKFQCFGCFLEFQSLRLEFFAEDFFIYCCKWIHVEMVIFGITTLYALDHIVHYQ